MFPGLEELHGKIPHWFNGIRPHRRQIYRLAEQDERFDVVAISDIGQPQILCHLLNKSMGTRDQVRLESNYLVSGSMRSRLISADLPTEMPWDVFDVDIVIDATGQFKSADQLQPHVNNGAGRVILSVLPEDEIDRVVLCGVNDQDIQASDRIISAGSARPTAAALALKVIAGAYTINRHDDFSARVYK